jgi:hypothetical protein
MAFTVSTRVALDGNAVTIPGGVVFIDESGLGSGPWIIAKTLIDPAGVNVQFVLSNNAAKCDISSINGTTTPTGHGTAAGVLRVELPTDGTGLVNAAQSGAWTVTANAGTNLNTSALALESGGNLATIAGAIVSQGTALGTIKELMAAGSVTTNAPTYTTGQIDPLSLTTAGGLRIDLKDTAANTNNLNVNLAASAATVTVTGTLAVTQSGTWTVQPGNTANTTPWLVTDSATKATGGAVPASASYMGADAATALPTAATAGNIVGLMADKFGRPVSLISTIRDLVGTQTTTISASTAETTIVTAAASVFNDLIMLIVTNTSTATTTRIDFRDTTAGSVLFSLISIGGQQPVGFALPTPIPQTTVNTNWTAQCATSTTDIRIYAVFAKNR